MFLLLSGCPRRPVDFGRDGEPKSVDDLLARVRAAELSITAITGEAKLKASTDRGGGSAGLFVAVVEPAMVHLEALDFFGRPQAQLVTDGVTFGLYDAQAGKYFSGPASSPNLARVLPVVLPVPELAELLMGRVPRVNYTAPEMKFDAESGRFKVFLGRQQLEVVPPSYRVVKSMIEGGYSVEMDTIEPVGAFTFPKHAVLKNGESSMELWWKDVTLNVPAEASMFDFTPPEGVPVVPVDSRGLEVR